MSLSAFKMMTACEGISSEISTRAVESTWTYALQLGTSFLDSFSVMDESSRSERTRGSQGIMVSDEYQIEELDDLLSIGDRDKMGETREEKEFEVQKDSLPEDVQFEQQQLEEAPVEGAQEGTIGEALEQPETEIIDKQEDPIATRSDDAMEEEEEAFLATSILDDNNELAVEVQFEEQQDEAALSVSVEQLQEEMAERTGEQPKEEPIEEQGHNNEEPIATVGVIEEEEPSPSCFGHDEDSLNNAPLDEVQIEQQQQQPPLVSAEQAKEETSIEPVDEAETELVEEQAHADKEPIVTMSDDAIEEEALPTSLAPEEDTLDSPSEEVEIEQQQQQEEEAPPASVDQEQGESSAEEPLEALIEEQVRNDEGQAHYEENTLWAPSEEAQIDQQQQVLSAAVEHVHHETFVKSVEHPEPELVDEEADNNDKPIVMGSDDAIEAEAPPVSLRRDEVNANPPSEEVQIEQQQEEATLSVSVEKFQEDEIVACAEQSEAELSEEQGHNHEKPIVAESDDATEEEASSPSSGVFDRNSLHSIGGDLIETIPESVEEEEEVTETNNAPEKSVPAEEVNDGLANQSYAAEDSVQPEDCEVTVAESYSEDEEAVNALLDIPPRPSMKLKRHESFANIRSLRDRAHYAWRPEWTTNPDILKQTENGDVIRTGVCLQKPITNIRDHYIPRSSLMQRSISDSGKSSSVPNGKAQKPKARAKSEIFVHVSKPKVTRNETARIQVNMTLPINESRNKKDFEKEKRSSWHKPGWPQHGVDLKSNVSLSLKKSRDKTKSVYAPI